MKLLIVVLLFFVTNDLVNCGVVSDVYGTVKNTTKSVKDNVYGWWNSGKEYVFGKDRSHQIGVDEESGAVQVHKGIISTVYDKIYNFFDIFGETNDNERKGYVKKLYEAIMNRVVKVKHFIIPDSKCLEECEQENVEENRSKLKDAVSKIFFKKNITNTMANKDIVNKWTQLLNEVQAKAQGVGGQAKSAYEKEIELLKTNFKKIQDGAVAVGDDAKKLTNAASDAVKKDFQNGKGNK